MSTADSPTKPTAARPQLPYSHMNPFLSPANTLKSPVVKYQVITREGQEITVGRVKIPTPGNGHAFILRRFDTGAISQTTMFRAAFPTSPEELEKVESAWVKQSFDCSTANGGSGKSSLRLAGTWVHPETASELAPLYYLEPIVTSLLSARPDPNQEYRRSTKAGSNNNNNSNNAPPTSASTENGASSPVKASGRAPLSPRASPKPTKRRREEREATPDSQSSTGGGLGLPTRRVVRGSSPALPVVPGSGSGSPNTQRISRTKMTKTVVNRSSPVKGESSPKKAGVTAATAAATTTRSVIVEKVREEEDEEVVDVPGPNMHEDIAEQKELIAKLKAERDANAAAAALAAAAASKTEAEDSKEGKEEEEEETQVPEPEPQSSKRAREDEQEGGQQEVLQFKFREPEEQEVIAAREIRSNKRLSLDLEPQQKSAAWGALWFVSGLAAAVTIPSFFL